MKNALWLFTVTIVLLLIFIPSYSKMQDLRQKNDEYGQRIEELKVEKKELLVEKRLLEDDPEYLEKVARDKMGLVKENEIIFKMTPPEQSSE